MVFPLMAAEKVFAARKKKENRSFFSVFGFLKIEKMSLLVSFVFWGRGADDALKKISEASFLLSYDLTARHCRHVLTVAGSQGRRGEACGPLSTSTRVFCALVSRIRGTSAGHLPMQGPVTVLVPKYVHRDTWRCGAD